MIVGAVMGVLVWATPPDAGKVEAEYLAKLTATAPTAEAQFRLANWAKRQGLNDVAQGHLRAAVHIDPKYAAAQKALGRSARSGIWESRSEHQARVERDARLETERSEWRGRFQELGVEAAAKGRSLNEAAAAALEEFASNDQMLAMAAVRAYRASEQGAATWGLVRQAVASRFADVRSEAAKALADRNPDHYLPPLVEYMRPITGGKSVLLGVGDIWRWQEGDVQITALPVPRLQQWASTAPPFQQSVMEERHAELDRLRGNAAAALETATGLKLGNDFTKWRQAAMQISDVTIGNAAPPVAEATTYYEPDVMVVGTRIFLPSAG